MTKRREESDRSRSTRKPPKGGLNLGKRGGKAPTAGQQTGQPSLFCETAASPQGSPGAKEREKAAAGVQGMPKSQDRDHKDWSAMVTLEEVARE
jgi:hypothetical protein